MMADYTVDQVLQAGEAYEFPKGTGQMLVPYKLTLVDEREPVTLNQKQDRDPPKDGDTLTGDINQDRKFKREWLGSGNQPPSNGSAADPPDRYDRKPDHPQNVERMRHTSALSAAPAYYQLLREEGVQDKPADKAEMLNTLSGLILWLEGTYPVPEA